MPSCLEFASNLIFKGTVNVLQVTFTFLEKSFPKSPDCLDSIPTGTIQSTCKYQTALSGPTTFLSFLILLKYVHLLFTPLSLFSFPRPHFIYTVWKFSDIHLCAMNLNTFFYLINMHLCIASLSATARLLYIYSSTSSEAHKEERAAAFVRVHAST